MPYKSVFSSRALMIFLVSVLANPVFAKDTLAQIHIPWNLMNTKIQRVLTTEGLLRSQWPDMVIEAAGVSWKLSGIRADAQLSLDRSRLNEKLWSVHFSSISARIAIDQISVDQTIERNEGGIIARIQVKASCGPLRLIQEKASGDLSADIDWSSGRPLARAVVATPTWPSQSWVLTDFECQGTTNLAQRLKSEILNRFKEPTDFHSQISSFIANSLQSKIDLAVTSLEAPFQLSTGEAQSKISIANLKPVPTGLIASLQSADVHITEDMTFPNPQLLNELPLDKPVLVGSVATIEALLKNELAHRPGLLSFQLNQNSSFQSLLSSRFLQFFLWPDLWNYSKKSPFYLRLAMPKDLSLSIEDGKVETRLPLQAVVQSKRDGQWWDYVGIHGSSKAIIDCQVSSGLMTYTTSLRDPSLSAGFLPAYQKKYGDSGWLPESTLEEALTGTQSSLSGSLHWPDLNVENIGQFQADRLDWIDPQTFVIEFPEKNP